MWTKRHLRAHAFSLLLIGGWGYSLAGQAAGFDCIVTPSQTIELGSAVPGVLEKVLVDRSSRVKAGQLLATLDSRMEKANLAIAHFRAETDTEVKLREAAMKIDQRTQARMSSLAARKIASKQDRDRALRDARLSMWRARQAKDDKRLYKLEYQRAEAALEQRMIRSPIDGVVVARLRNAGEYVDDQPVLRIIQLDPLYVEAILPMSLFGQVAAGMTARVVPEFNGNKGYEAKVELIDPMGDASSGTFGVRLVMPNPDAGIPAGLKCQVEFDATELRAGGRMADNSSAGLSMDSLLSGR